MTVDESTQAESLAETLWARHADELMRFATSMVGPSDAADLVSVAFVQGLASGGLARAEQPRAYLYRSVLNAARDDLRSTDRRRRRERRVATLDTTEAATGGDPEVWAALRLLSERQRAVVYLTYWMDLAPEAIADLLDLSTGTVKQHLDRGRKALRIALGGTR